MFAADASKGGKRFAVRAETQLAAFSELQRQIHTACGDLAPPIVILPQDAPDSAVSTKRRTVEAIVVIGLIAAVVCSAIYLGGGPHDARTKRPDVPGASSTAKTTPAVIPTVKKPATGDEDTVAKSAPIITFETPIPRAQPVSRETPYETALRALPVSPTPQRQLSFFTVGSTRDDVLRVQGSPDAFTDSAFRYGSSSVFFLNGLVTGWESYYPKLRNGWLAHSSPPARGFFTIGSTRDEVVLVQGTPDAFDSTTFRYGSSTVFFENGVVKSWETYYPPLKARLLPQR